MTEQRGVGPEPRRPPWGDGPPPWVGRGGFDAGRRFRRGALVALTVLVLLVASLATVAASILGGNPPAAWITVTVAGVVVVGLVLSARWLWRNARGVGALMDAADRVAGGDYATRVRAPSSRQLRPLIAAFNEMTDRLETNERRRRELLGDVAHELRTPLQVIRGSVEGMLDGLYPADPATLRTLLDETLVMARLLEDLRTLSMAEEGVLPLHREPVDPRLLVEDAARSFDALAREADVSLEVETDGDGTALEADPVRLAEVLGNLLSNAIRHTPAGGSVRVRSEQEHAAVAFEVIDTGTGIPDEELALVFDRFVRSADTGGTGLGLAIARRLVEAHGGAIGATRAPEGGTRVRFTIPREGRR
jgi:signal transduction histidine kinase